ncbi:MAG: NUDIX hydrolase [Balneolaceae bacterium]
MDSFIRFLSTITPDRLPGEAAHCKLRPLTADGTVYRPSPPDLPAHPCGVLVPLHYEKDGSLMITYTLRTESIRHAGQISFPGGRCEADETPHETAIREAREEIALPPSVYKTIAELSPLVIPRTNNRVTPFVVLMESPITFQRNPSEVEEVITLPFRILLQPGIFKQERWQYNGHAIDVPFWDVHHTPLWGATAMITSELVALYEQHRQAQEDDNG